MFSRQVSAAIIRALSTSFHNAILQYLVSLAEPTDISKSYLAVVYSDVAVFSLCKVFTFLSPVITLRLTACLSQLRTLKIYLFTIRFGWATPSR
jgi:hypothetical protein